jgi:hypothetical protein
MVGLGNYCTHLHLVVGNIPKLTLSKSPQGATGCYCYIVLLVKVGRTLPVAGPFVGHDVPLLLSSYVVPSYRK